MRNIASPLLDDNSSSDGRPSGVAHFIGYLSKDSTPSTVTIDAASNVELSYASYVCGCIPRTTSSHPTTITAIDLVGALQPTPYTLQILYMPLVNPKSHRPTRRTLKKTPILRFDSPEQASQLISQLRTIATFSSTSSSSSSSSSQPTTPIASTVTITTINSKDIDTSTSNPTTINTTTTTTKTTITTKRIFTVINPASGKGNAVSTYTNHIQPIWEAAGFSLKHIITTAPQHATQVVKTLKPQSCDVIASVGGDGTTFEVLQGMLSRPDWSEMATIPIVQIPAGSGNALAASSGLWDAVTAAHAVVKSTVKPLDIASVVQLGEERKFSFLSLTYGTIPSLDIGTEHLRVLGEARFTYGAIKEILMQRAYKLRVAYFNDVDGDGEQQGTTTTGTNNNTSTTKNDEQIDGGTTNKTSNGDISEDSLRLGDGPPLKHHKTIANLLDKSTLVDHHQQLHPPHWKHINGNTMLFAACNISHLSTSFHFAPLATHNNGLLHLIYLPAPSTRMQGLKILLKSETGEHLHLMQNLHVSAVVLEPLSERKTWVVLDGEAVKHAMTGMEVHRGLCRTIVAPPAVV